MFWILLHPTLYLISLSLISISGFFCFQAKMSNSRSLKQLRGLAQSLEEVRELATKFKFDIPLHQLRQVGGFQTPPHPCEWQWSLLRGKLRIRMIVHHPSIRKLLMCTQCFLYHCLPKLAKPLYKSVSNISISLYFNVQVKFSNKG